MRPGFRHAVALHVLSANRPPTSAGELEGWNCPDADIANVEPDLARLPNGLTRRRANGGNGACDWRAAARSHIVPISRIPQGSRL